MRALIHLGNVLVLCSFLVRDILWLRALSILAGLSFLVYFGTSTPPVWEPVGWNLVFLSLNLVQIVRLLRERRPVQFAPDELALYTTCFRALEIRSRAFSWHSRLTAAAGGDHTCMQAGMQESQRRSPVNWARGHQEGARNPCSAISES